MLIAGLVVGWWFGVCVVGFRFWFVGCVVGGLLLLFVLVFDSLFILVVCVCCFVVIAGVVGCWGGGLLVDCLRCWLRDFVCYLILGGAIVGLL